MAFSALNKICLKIKRRNRVLMDPLGGLESLQTKILKSIAEMERSIGAQLALSDASDHVPNSSAGGGSDTAESTKNRLSDILRTMGVSDFAFGRVPYDYHEKTLEERKEILGAYSVLHIFKSIVLVNTQAPSNITDCSDHKNSKYYIVVLQHAARLNAESIKNFLYELNNQKIPKKRFNLRLAPEEESLKLTGFEHNAVTCVGMKTDIPVILDEAITELQPDFFWLGGGDVELMLGVRTSQFITAINPFLVRCSS